MAVGDKKPVLMQADRGAAGGVAALDANGKVVGAAPEDKTVKIVEDVLTDGMDVLNLKAGIYRLAGAAVVGLPEGHSMWGTIEIARFHGSDWGTAYLTDISNNRSWIAGAGWNDGLLWQEIYTSANLTALRDALKAIW